MSHFFKKLSHYLKPLAINTSNIGLNCGLEPHAARGKTIALESKNHWPHAKITTSPPIHNDSVG